MAHDRLSGTVSPIEDRAQLHGANALPEIGLAVFHSADWQKVCDVWRIPHGIARIHGYTAMLGYSGMGGRIHPEYPLIAMGVVQGVRDSGYRVPEDVAVIGFDDIPIASHPDIQLSTIHQPKYRIGTYAAEILLRQLNQDPFERRTERMTLQPELIVRRST